MTDSGSTDLEYGDLVLLIDQKKRRYLVTLEDGKEFQTHAGNIEHASIVENGEGSEVATTKGQKFIVFRPSLSDFIINMPRGAQVIYPKDIGAILMMADIAPGLKVFESGVGSGALSSAMLRAGANITGYELREDFAATAKRNVSRFLGEQILERYDVQIRNAYDGIDDTDFDRVVLDLPEPWNVVPYAAQSLKKGGTIVSYSPSIMQVSQVDEALKSNGFSEILVTEVLHRTWHVSGQAVRPDHRMVAHTGFLSKARLLA